MICLILSIYIQYVHCTEQRGKVTIYHYQSTMDLSIGIVQHIGFKQI